MRWSQVARGALWSVLVVGAVSWAGCADDPSLAKRAPAPPGAPQVAAQGVQVSQFYAGEPGAGVNFLSYPAQNNKTSADWGPVMTDVIQHLPLSYGNTYYDSDKITYTHETSHGIHSELRNNHNNTGQRANAFYVPGNRAAIVVEPNVRKSVAAAHIPASLRGSRYDLYIAGSQSWDDTPLYIWDEWNAYVNGGEAGVDLANRGLWTAGWRDGVMGQLEFTVYAIALAKGVRAQDPGYFSNNTQFKEFLAFNTRRAMEVFRAGSTIESFRWDQQDQYYERMRSSPDAAEWRAFCRELFGEAWANAVIFGQGSVPEGGDPDPGVEPEPEVQPDPEVQPEPEGQDPEPALPQDPGGDNPQPPTDPDGFNPDNPPQPPPPAGSGNNGGNGGNGGAGDNPGGNGGNGGDPGAGDQGGPANDRDGDGVLDALDLCSATPQGRNVWRQGEWIGCAGGEFRDRLPRVQGADVDLDGIADGTDLCSGTASGAPVWTWGEWVGCGEGQIRDRDR